MFGRGPQDQRQGTRDKGPETRDQRQGTRDMHYRWVLRPDPTPQLTEQLSRQLNDLPVALARALTLRGIESFDKARLFFRPSLEYLHDPFLMKGMEEAATRILEARDRNERVLVYGDYDVDGTTSAALMTLFLRSIGIEATFWIPHRIEDGYGLCNTGIDLAVDRSASLIVALDCGITALDEARYARDKGLDLIVCDHHNPGPELPDAVAVLDPKRKDCPYPFKELSGCGIGFKVVQAVLSKMGEPAEKAYEFLDLVAISTASDIVPLEDENRVLMVEGLKRLCEAPRLGLRVLAQVGKVDLSKCTTSQIVFGIGPRINAAGRMGDARSAVELLIADDEQKAYRIASQLEQANQERRDIDRSTLKEAAKKAEHQLGGDFQHSIVVHDENWHPGVIGIVASRLVERFYRPAIMLTTVQGEVKGSARSIEGINIYHALKACSDLLTTFGGHDFAAGMALTEENVPRFKERFNEVVGEMITPDLLNPSITFDAQVQIDDIGDRFWAVLRQFSPFGPANDRPIFKAAELELARPPRRIGRDGDHLKFWVRQRGHAMQAMEVVGFGLHHHFDTLQESKNERIPFEMLFTVDENHWNGVTSLQLKARDVRLQKRNEV